MSSTKTQQPKTHQEPPLDKPVKDFIVGFSEALNRSANTNEQTSGIRTRTETQILNYYSIQFNKHTERVYKNANWPTVEVILPLVNNDENFGLLYDIMRVRHMCGRLGNKIGLEVRVHAFQLYTQLFNKVMNGEFSFDLPNEWLWDLMDEFLYNFQTFCQYRQKKSVASTAQKEELEKVWHVRDVLTILEKLVQVSQIEKLLTSAQQKSLDLLKAGKTHTLTMLGYYSMIGLLRVHTILGDFATALESVSAIPLFGSDASVGRSSRIFFNEYIYSRVIACHVTLFYFYTFCCLASGKYYSAVRLLNLLLVYLNRYLSNNKGASDLSFQNEFVAKMSEQCYGLLALSVLMLTGNSQSYAGVFIVFTSKSLPGNFRLEESVRVNLREKFGDKMNKIYGSMINGTNEYIPVVEEILVYCAPKLINPSIDVADDNPAKFVRLFVKQGEVAHMAQLCPVKSWIRLFTQTDLKVLSKQIKSADANAAETSDSQLRDLCHSLKHKSIHRLTIAPASNVAAPDDVEVQFVLTDNKQGNAEVSVGSEKVFRHFGDYFIRNAQKFCNVE